MSSTTLVLPPALVAKFKNGLSVYKDRLAQARATNDLDRKILDIFAGMLTGADEDPTLEQPLTALKTIILDGSSIADALARLGTFDRPDHPTPDQQETPSYVKDIIKALNELRSEVYDLSGRTASVERFLQDRFGFVQEEPKAKASTRKSAAATPRARIEPEEPSQLALDYQAGRDFVSAQPVVSHEGSVGGSNHHQNEDVVGIPISDREHINGLVSAITTLAKAQKRPLLIGEIKAEMLRTGAPFAKMSGTWVNTTLAQNFIRWGDPKKRGGGWWPINMVLGEVNGHLYQQVTLPLNDAEAEAAAAVTDAYHQLRLAQNLPPLIVHRRVRKSKR